MRFVRWAVALAAVALMIWFVLSVRVGSRTIAGHVRRWAEARMPAETPARSGKSKAKVSARGPVREEPATQRRVSLLETAARQAEEIPPPVGVRQRTSTDERLSKANKKALDDLVSSRVSRR